MARPTLACGLAKTARVVAIRNSHSQAVFRPAPMQYRSIAAMTGLPGGVSAGYPVRPPASSQSAPGRSERYARAVGKALSAEGPLTA